MSGRQVITSLGGKDATAEFEDIGHTNAARNLGKSFVVGMLEGKEVRGPC